MSCPLCNPKEEKIIFKNSLFRIVLIDEIPGYLRLITNTHIKEFSELNDKEAIEITLAIKKIEEVMLDFLKPDKINIATLGNMVPHLHFHIIPRYKNDPWWPGAIFCDKQREFNYPKFNKNLFIKEIRSCF